MERGSRQSRIPRFPREGLPQANSLSIALTRAPLCYLFTCISSRRLVAALVIGSLLFACPHWVWWVGGERVSGQGPDQTIQESEIYIFVR